MIKISNIDKYYNKGKSNELHVLNNISLELPECGLVSFLGPSGSGKTTLLNVIGGLDSAKGEIDYDSLMIKNYNMKQIDAFRRKEIGYVFQSFNLLHNESVYDNLVVALEMIDIYDKEEQEKRIKYVLDAVGMYKYRKKKAYALSGGQQQRVAIARALLKHSKIIIADEPTGNLDSENTLAVMNILKQISKKTLVLLVTHNDKIANFYSDVVYKITDGKIISSTTNSNANLSLDERNTNNIYLQDLEKLQLQNDLVDIEFYSNEKKNEKLNLRIVEKSGTYYIESLNNIKLVNQTNLKLLDEHYEAIKQEDIDNYDYDDSWFSNSNKKKKSSFGRLLKESFHSMSNIRKKTKFLYISFFIIGILFAINIITFSNYFTLDTKNFCTDGSYESISSSDYYNSREDQIVMDNAINNNLIKDVNRIIYTYAEYIDRLNFNEQIVIKIDTLPVIEYLSSNKYAIKYGSIPKDREILISKSVADTFIANSKGQFKHYEDLIGLMLDFNHFENLFKISGIIDNPYRMAYLSANDYFDLLQANESINSIVAPYYLRKYTIEKELGNYKVVLGRDFIQDDFYGNFLLVSDKYPSYETLINDTITLGEKTYTIIGAFHMDNISYTAKDFITYKDSNLNMNDNYYIVNGFKYVDYDLIKGNNPVANNECLASVYSGLNIGDKVNGCIVTGLFNAGSEILINSILYSRDKLITNIGEYNKALFKVLDKEQLTGSIKEKFKISNAYDELYHEEKMMQNLKLGIFGTFSIVLLIIIIIFIYFLMRSRMINEIYPIGVYRSLGAPKKKIYLKFLADILVITTFTAAIGYLVVLIFYGGQVNFLFDVFGTYVVKFNWLINILGFVILYAINIIFGLLPIHLLVKKTPAEIISKYDI